MMQWPNIKWIYIREMTDQFRDRRTLLAVFLMPLMMYPLIGMAFMMVSQFVKEHRSEVLVIGLENLPPEPGLIMGNLFSEAHAGETLSKLIGIQIDDASVFSGAKIDEDRIQQVIHDELYDLVIVFPEGFATQFLNLAERLRQSGEDREFLEITELPCPIVYSDSTRERSSLTRGRVTRILESWQTALVERLFESARLPQFLKDPVQIESKDVAIQEQKRVEFLSSVVPYMMLIMALVGAFHPAVDVCAGEKERGTLETLLSSPASRNEIVVAKLMTVMSFSMTSSVINLLGLGMTAAFIGSQGSGLGGEVIQFGLPPMMALVATLPILIPMAAFFSAVSLAVATFARSTKEGQYYMVPMMMASLPLMVVGMMPGTELDLGTSLIPVTGMMLVLEAILKSEYHLAFRYITPVLLVTFSCIVLSVRWAVAQFRNEAVLFRESERWNLVLLLKHGVKNRKVLHGSAAAVFAAVFIMTFRLAAGNFGIHPDTPEALALLNIASQILTIALPCVVLAWLTARDLRGALRLGEFRTGWVVSASVLAIVFHPVAVYISRVIEWLYPVHSGVKTMVEQAFGTLGDADFFYVFLMIAVTPAICEELAFRGYILTGLQRDFSRGGAVFLSSFFFGVTHGILQQSISAFFVGLVIGTIAVQARSLWPCMAYHLVHNGVTVLYAFVIEDSTRLPEVLQSIVTVDIAVGEVRYSPGAILFGLVIVLLFYGGIYWRSDQDR